MPEPIAKGECETCGPFYLYKSKQIRVYFKPRPQLPEAVFYCPGCNLRMIEEISFKSAYIFANMGCVVHHYYDTKNDIQPIEEEEIVEFVGILECETKFWRLLEE